jgi:tetratricopeptide (TPR) repeat protein
VRVVLVTDREAAERYTAKWREGHPNGQVLSAPPPSEWPFRYPLCPALPGDAVLLRSEHVEDAFATAQTNGVQLVTTQPKYLEQEWTAALDRHGDALLLVTEGTSGDVSHPLANAYRLGGAAPRLAACVDVLNASRTAATLVAAASVCMEVNDLDAAARDLDEAISLAPEWAAAHYERGKLWLRSENMERAAEAFRRAAELLPTFVPSWGNLGATLGELDRPAEALAAFERALAIEPSNAQALNNIGVVRRELGRLAESEAAFRQVIQLMPEMAFGHYNLGHTLFLQGRFQAALSAYTVGQSKDAERNPVQASRLALCRVATGDARGALMDLQRTAANLPRQYRQEVLGEASAILWALVTQHPDMSGWQPVHEWLTKELKG